METRTFTAPDISCEHCKAAIEREIGAMSGVQTVTVNIPTRQVTVAYDPSRITIEDIETKLDDEGYPVAP